MHPVYDVDAILLLALSVSAKRRPAELPEIVAAISQEGPIPAAAKLVEAFERMSACGLIVASGAGYTLSADAQKMMESQRKKDDSAMKLARLKQHLADYRPKAELPAIQVGLEQFQAATKGHKAASNSPTRNLLASKPRPKAAWISGKELAEGKQHLTAKRRKS